MRILLVEDEDRLAAAVKRGLKAEGFAVDIARDGTDGLSMAQDVRHLILMWPSKPIVSHSLAICGALKRGGKSMPAARLWRPVSSTCSANPSNTF